MPDGPTPSGSSVSLTGQNIALLKELGADGYVTKPFEIDTLVDEIRAALAMQRSRV